MAKSGSSSSLQNAKFAAESNPPDKAFAEAATHEVMPTGTKSVLVAVLLMPGCEAIRWIRITDETAIELIEADRRGDERRRGYRRRDG